MHQLGTKFTIQGDWLVCVKANIATTLNCAGLFLV